MCKKTVKTTNSNSQTQKAEQSVKAAEKAQTKVLARNQLPVIYYTKDFSTYTATVDGTEYKGRATGVSFSPATKDAESLKILKQKLADAGYSNYYLVDSQYKGSAGNAIYYTMNYSVCTAVVDGVTYKGTTGGVSALPTTRDRAACRDLEEKLDAAGYTNYTLIEAH